MAKKEFKKELMHKTVRYLMILLIVLFVTTGYFYGRNQLNLIESANRNFLALLKSQTLHYLEHPMGELLYYESELDEDDSVLSNSQEDYHNYVLRIELLNQEGVVISTFPDIPERIGMDLSGNPFIFELKPDGLTFSDTFNDYLTGQTAMMVGKERANGELLIGYMSLDKLAYTFSTFKLEDSVFAIIDDRGNYILNSNPMMVATRSVDPYASDIKNGTIKPGDLVKYLDRVNSIEYTPIENTGWVLLIYQDFYRSNGPILFTITVVLILMLLLFYLVLRSFKRSFKELDQGFIKFIEMTKRVSDGDYTAIEPEQPFVEFDELSKNFITMIGEIESREEEIEKSNHELQKSKEELKASNDDLYATVQQLMAIEKEHREQNVYLNRQKTRLENLIKGTNAGTWEWDVETREVVINERWAEMLGYSLSSLTPFTLDLFYELLHPDDRCGLNRNIDMILQREDDLLESKFRMKHYSGEWIWINSIAKVNKYSESGKPLMISGIHIDISESVHSAQKIQERLIETELIAEFTSDLLVLKDKVLFEEIVHLLDRVCSIKGHHSWDLHLFEAIDFISILKEEKFKTILPKGENDYLREQYPVFYNLLQDENRVVLFSDSAFGKLESNEISWFHENGLKCVILCSLYRGQNLAGYFAFETMCETSEVCNIELQFYKILANTISEAIEKDFYEKGLIVSSEMAQAANIAKGQFLAKMSHEIRTPLNGISGYLQLISLSNQLKEVREFGDMATKVTNSMIRLIDDILDFSKIEAGKLKIIYEPVDIREKLSEVIDMYQFEAHNKEIFLGQNIAEELPQIVMTDPTRLKQIVSNLISNAIKFSDGGSVLIDVRFKDGGNENTEITLVVTDHGIGISKTQIHSVFETFNQGDNTNKRRYGGTGLGLSIVKQLVELMSGTIDVSSIPGKRTIFTIRLPVIVPKSIDYSHVLMQDVVSGLPIDNSKLRVLIVDDNTVNQIVVMKVLEKKGLICDVASNGLEAIDRINENDYDCVFMDVQMPIMDGYEATKLIRNMLDKADVFVVAMTANAMEGDRDKCLNAGMDDYISKPLDYSAMINLVKENKKKRWAEMKYAD